MKFNHCNERTDGKCKLDNMKPCFNPDGGYPTCSMFNRKMSNPAIEKKMSEWEIRRREGDRIKHGNKLI